MNTPYHRRGHLRSLIGPLWDHLRRVWTNPAYCALHRFERQIGGRARTEGGVVQFKGQQIRFVDNASFLSAWDEIFVNRIYDVEDVRNPLLVDVGSNIGLAALFWKERFGAFRYIGFEPDPEIAAVCRSNLDEWKVEGDLHVSALGSLEGRARFIPDGADGGHLDPASPCDHALEVDVERLSTHLCETIDLLKIDVEGSELAVVSEIRSKLHLVKRIFVEWHCAGPGDWALGDSIALLESAGFRVFVQVARGPQHPFLTKGAKDADGQNLNLFGLRI